MRGAKWFALGLMLTIASASRAQSDNRSKGNTRGPGLFGFMPSLFTGKSTTQDANKFPIPNQTLPSNRPLNAFIPKTVTPIGKMNVPRTTIPTYNPYASPDYLKAFHYRSGPPR